MKLAVICEKFGCSIRLTEERKQHIVSRHPEIRGNFNKIKPTLAKPDLIVANRYAADEKYYHRFFETLGNYLIVVVNTDKKFIITAFIAREVKKGKLQWKKD